MPMMIIAAAAAFALMTAAPAVDASPVLQTTLIAEAPASTQSARELVTGEWRLLSGHRHCARAQRFEFQGYRLNWQMIDYDGSDWVHNWIGKITTPTPTRVRLNEITWVQYESNGTLRVHELFEGECFYQRDRARGQRV